MTKSEYLKSVRQAKKIFGYIQMTTKRPVPTKISKSKALALVSQIGDDDEIRASWAGDDKFFLLIG